jgi:hypothetical protein
VLNFLVAGFRSSWQMALRSPANFQNCPKDGSALIGGVKSADSKLYREMALLNCRVSLPMFVSSGQDIN